MQPESVPRWMSFRGKAQQYDSPRGSISPINVVGITQDGWYDQWMNRQHMMWAMKDWCPVLYVQEPRGWSRSAQPRDERFFCSRYIKEQDSLGVLQLPKSLAFRAKPGGWNRSIVKMKGRKILRKVVPNKETPLVLYLWEPQLVDYARVLQPDVLIYHMFDLVKTVLPYRLPGACRSRSIPAPFPRGRYCTGWHACSGRSNSPG